MVRVKPNNSECVRNFIVRYWLRLELEKDTYIEARVHRALVPAAEFTGSLGVQEDAVNLKRTLIPSGIAK